MVRLAKGAIIQLVPFESSEPSFCERLFILPAAVLAWSMHNIPIYGYNLLLHISSLGFPNGKPALDFVFFSIIA